VATDTWAAGASEYPEAAAELRRGDFPAAWARLAPLTEGETATARKARLVAGLYAHAAERTDLASEMLAGAAEPGGLLEDWRLFVLALSLSERSALPAARATLGELATRLPRSPLAPRALARTAEIAAEQGDLPGAEAAIAAVRERVLDPALRRQVERMAWDLATAHGLGELKREAARRLLVVDPVEASKLGAVELLRQPSGEVPWSSLFTADELRDRARNLLDAKLADGALATLAEVREADRDLAWALLEAEGLTRAGRAAEALAVLGRFPMPADARRLEVLWAAAEAGLEAAEARGGRTNLPSERRAALHEAALEDLERIADSGAPEPARRALLRLWQEHDLDHSYEKAMAVLERLRALDPEDTTGAEALWRLGWEELDGSDPRGAIAVWSRLETLYPGTRWARGGRYWSGVAHARLGDAGRARALWTSLTLADTEDFYSRHARSRLGADLPEPTLEAPTPLPWPNDPRLERARLLSDLGLDRLALDELDTQARAAEPRAVEALRALVHERMGDRRASIHALREVFHDLGGAHQAAVPGDARRMYYPLDYHDLVARHAERQGLSPFLVLAIIRQESAFDARAVSRSGARGLMQIVPATGRELALKAGLPYATERLLDPEFSIQLGSRYFRQVLDMFDGDVELALAGYNGGPYRIRSWWRTAGTGVGVDRFIDGLALEESRLYVHRILVFADSYQQLYGQRG
jgi:soluble lytic murein transglycosylase